MCEIQLKIGDTEYEFDGDYHPHSSNDRNTPCIFLRGHFYYGKAKKENNIPIDWEIQSFYYATRKNTITDRTLGGTFYTDHYATEEEMLKSDWSIYSVKRLSDNQVFKIGDYFTYHLRNITNPISGFIINNNIMSVTSDGILGSMELKHITKRDKPIEPLSNEDLKAIKLIKWINENYTQVHHYWESIEEKEKRAWYTNEQLYQLYLQQNNMNKIEMELISKSVNEQVKKTAIAFKEWQDYNLEDKGWTQYDGHDTWINPHTREVKSTEQLYEIFLDQLK